MVFLSPLHEDAQPWLSVGIAGSAELEPTGSSFQHHVQWRHVSSLRSAQMGVFTRWKSGNATDLGFSFYPRPSPGAGCKRFSSMPWIAGVSEARMETILWGYDHTGPYLAPDKVHSHILHEVPKNNQETVRCGGPLQREKGTSLSFYFPHIWNKTKWERKHKSIQLSQNMTAWLTSATWQGYLHPVKAGDWCAIDTVLNLPKVTAFESRLFVHHTIPWRPLPKLTPWRGCHCKKWLIPWHQQHLVNFSITASPSSCSSSVEPFVKVNISWSWTIHYFLSHAIYCQLLWNHGKHTMNSPKVLRSF